MSSLNLTNIEKSLEVSFKNKSLLTQALTHRSYLNEHPDFASSNERLEFLGDAILEFWVSRELFERFPGLPEGVLTDLRAKIVRTESLTGIGRKLNLGRFLLLSRGEEIGGGRENESLLANCFEALIGAVFCDQGIVKVEKFLENFVLPKINKFVSGEIKAVKPEELKGPKSFLQEIAQERFKITPTYKVLKSEGPDHAKIFLIGVYLGEKMVGQGKGWSKQEAEETAASEAAQHLSNLSDLNYERLA